MIPGALLASGRSVRMGRSKALLPVGPGGPTFVRRLAESLRAGGIDDVLIVGRREDEMLRREVDTLGGGARYVENRDADQGQISSIVCAVDAIDRPGVVGLLVLPVDQPLVTAETVAALIAAFVLSRPPVARAVYQGRHGHPVIFSSSTFHELRRADRRVGAKAVLRARQHGILDVDVADQGVVIDVDDPETYARLFGPLDAAEGS